MVLHLCSIVQRISFVDTCKSVLHEGEPSITMTVMRTIGPWAWLKPITLCLVTPRSQPLNSLPPSAYDSMLTFCFHITHRYPLYSSFISHFPSSIIFQSPDLRDVETRSTTVLYCVLWERKGYAKSNFNDCVRIMHDFSLWELNSTEKNYIKNNLKKMLFH